MYRQQIAKKNTPSLASSPKTQKTRPTPRYGSLSGMIQRATAKPETLRREEWRQLDGAVGTRATKEIQSGKQTSYVPEFKGISSQLLGESGGKETPIQAKLTIGAAGDKYEQEADRVAAEVVKQIHSPAPVSKTQGEVVQGKSSKEEEGELQRKSLVQRRTDAGGEASADLTSAINSARDGGQPLEAGLQQSMGEAMGTDFRGVRVHTDARSDELNQSIQAKAMVAIERKEYAKVKEVLYSNALANELGANLVVVPVSINKGIEYTAEDDDGWLHLINTLENLAKQEAWFYPSNRDGKMSEIKVPNVTISRFDMNTGNNGGDIDMMLNDRDGKRFWVMVLEEWMHMYQDLIGGVISARTREYRKSGFWGSGDGEIDEVDTYAVVEELGWTDILEKYRERYRERRAFAEWVSQGMPRASVEAE